MATGFYTLGGVSVAAGSTTLTATTFAAPGSAPEAVNFANLVGIAGADGTPAGHVIIGPAGQVAVARHAASASQLTLAKPWPGAAVSNGECTLVLGINAMPIGRLAALMTQIALTRPMLASNRLSEFAADPVAQSAVQTNLGLPDAFLQKSGGSITGALSIGSSAAPAAELEVHALGGDSDVRIQLRPSSGQTAQFGSSNTQAFVDVGQNKHFVTYTGGVARITVHGTTGVATFAQRPVFAGETPFDTGNVATARNALGQKWVTVSDQTVSGAAVSTVDFTLNASFKHYRLTVLVAPNSAVADFSVRFRTSSNNGSSYDSGASDYATHVFAYNGATPAAGVGASASGVFMSLSDTGTVYIPALIYADFFSGGGGLIPTMRTRGANFNGADNVQQFSYTQRSSTTQATNLRLLGDTGAAVFGIGSRFLLEGC